MQRLYNNITIPDEWKSQEVDEVGFGELDVPYLENKPEYIDISIGRQLFVDDFLIRETNLERTEHRPIPYENNPVFEAETVWEKGIPERAYEEARPSAAILFSGGMWYDGEADIYRMWYAASFHGSIAYAESKDGVNFTRVDTDLYENSNLVMPRGGSFYDTCAVVMNGYRESSIQEKYVMSLYVRPAKCERVGVNIYTSQDGIHWTMRCHTAGGDDTTNITYNPFHKKWIYSIKKNSAEFGRRREYSQCDDLVRGREFRDRLFWLRADEKDIPHPVWQCKPELYLFNSIAYESIMLGAMDIFKGPQNDVSMKRGLPKITEIHICYSRDGYHYSRQTDRTPFIGASEDSSKWDNGYVHASNTICTIEGDKLVFRYSAFQGDETRIDPNYEELNGMYANGRIGIAYLRRDGFASLDGEGSVLTEKLKFSGEYLFVNADVEGMTAEIMDETGNVIPGFEQENCIPFNGNSCRAKIEWKQKSSLANIGNQPIMIRFFQKAGRFYSFWISETESGESNGYLAGGEKGKMRLVDEVGMTT